MTSGHDTSAHLWDMLTKVEGGECALGVVKSVHAKMWRGVQQSEGAQEECKGVWGECEGVWGECGGSVRECGGSVGGV